MATDRLFRLVPAPDGLPFFFIEYVSQETLEQADPHTRYRCPCCQKAFGYKGTLKRHLKRFHAEDRVSQAVLTQLFPDEGWPCTSPGCAKRFRSLYSRMRHVETKHQA